MMFNTIYPRVVEIAVIIVGDYSVDEYTYDVLVHDKEYGLKACFLLTPGLYGFAIPIVVSLR